MMKKIVIIVSQFLFFILIPVYIIPTISRIFGFNVFKGVGELVVEIYFDILPVLVYKSSDTYLFIGFIYGATTFCLYMLYREIVLARARLREQIVEMIPLISSYVRTGTPILTAIENAANFVGDPTKSYLIRFAELVKLGHSPEESMRIVFKNMPRDVVSVYMSIAVAISSGGRVQDVLSTAEKYVYQLSKLEELRKNRLEGYKAILVLALIAFTTSAIVTTLLISYVARISIVPLSPSVGPSAIDVSRILSYYYTLILVLTPLTSIALSRIVYNETILALKYITIFITIISIVFAIIYKLFI